jgi:hypothetical protein
LGKAPLLHQRHGADAKYSRIFEGPAKGLPAANRGNISRNILPHDIHTAAAQIAVGTRAGQANAARGGSIHVSGISPQSNGSLDQGGD